MEESVKQPTKKQQTRAQSRASSAPKVTVAVKCIVCGSRRQVGPGEVAADDVPHCNQPMCFGICVAVSAKGTIR